MLGFIIAGFFVSGLMFMGLWFMYLMDGDEITALISGAVGATMITMGSILTLAVLGAI